MKYTDVPVQIYLQQCPLQDGNRRKQMFETTVQEYVAKIASQVTNSNSINDSDNLSYFYPFACGILDKAGLCEQDSLNCVIITENI